DVRACELKRSFLDVWGDSHRQRAGNAWVMWAGDGGGIAVGACGALIVLRRFDGCGWTELGRIGAASCILSTGHGPFLLRAALEPIGVEVGLQWPMDWQWRSGGINLESLSYRWMRSTGAKEARRIDRRGACATGHSIKDGVLWEAGREPLVGGRWGTSRTGSRTGTAGARGRFPGGRYLQVDGEVLAGILRGVGIMRLGFSFVETNCFAVKKVRVHLWGLVRLVELIISGPKVYLSSVEAALTLCGWVEIGWGGRSRMGAVCLPVDMGQGLGWGGCLVGLGGYFGEACYMEVVRFVDGVLLARYWGGNTAAGRIPCLLGSLG
ncbi:hypothetical protein Tco_0756877, partial [Tanacetum coccineum]